MRRDGTGAAAAEFFRYFIASAVGLAIDFSLYVSLTEFAGLHYLMSAVVGFCAGAIAVYTFSILWVFSERRLADSGWELAIFCFIGVAGLLVTELILYVFTGVLGVDYRLSKVIAAGSVFLINFGLRKRILFTRLPA